MDAMENAPPENEVANEVGEKCTTDEDLVLPACPLQEGVCAGSTQRCAGTASQPFSMSSACETESIELAG